MGGLSGTLTSLTQLHVPELEHLHEVSIGTPHRPTGRRPMGRSTNGELTDEQLDRLAAHPD